MGIIRYIMWCYLLNDFDRTLANGDTFVFKKPDTFVKEGGVIVYLNNANARWRHNQPNLLLTNRTTTKLCTRQGDTVDCSKFSSLDQLKPSSANNKDGKKELTGDDVAVYYASMLENVCMFEKQLVVRLR